MPVWTTAIRVQRGLSGADEADLTTPLETFITDASALAQADLDPIYWAFPAVTQTPATPLFIQQLVADKVISMARMELGQVSELNPEQNPEGWSYAQRYESAIAALRTGTAMIPQETITAEAMTFGTDPYDDNEHAFNPGALSLDGFEVIPESVRVTGYEFGHDFTARFNEHNRSWVFVRYSGAIVDATTVTYKISYRKAREKGKTPKHDTSEMLLA